MTTINFDIGYLKTGQESLDTYLGSKILFWPLHAPSPMGERDFPRLTLGNLLLSLKRLEIRDLTQNQSNQLRTITREIHKVQFSKKRAWTRKANHEFESRIRQWSLYLTDLRHDPKGQEVYYHSEVRTRVIIDLLIPELDEQESSKLEELSELDEFLAKILTPKDFLWGEELSKGFDEKQFWYLWGIPKLVETLLR